MSEVALSIGGRSYKVACADGEEAHVRRLGEAIDAKLGTMPQLSAQDTQNLLFGALLLADELHDLRNSQTASAGEAEHASGGADGAQAQADELARQAAEADEHKQALEALRGELEELRQAEADMGADLQAAQAAETELRRELSALSSERDALREQVEAAQGAPAATAFDDPNLAPALERFAELLESCADKLEGRAASS